MPPRRYRPPPQAGNSAGEPSEPEVHAFGGADAMNTDRILFHADSSHGHMCGHVTTIGIDSDCAVAHGVAGE